MENWEWSQERNGDELTGYIHYALNIIHGSESIPLNETQVANSLNSNSYDNTKGISTAYFNLQKGKSILKGI